MGKTELGRANVIEQFVKQGRVPQFLEPIQQDDKIRIPCLVPGIEGQESEVILVTKESKTQLQRRIDRALGVIKS